MPPQLFLRRLLLVVLAVVQIGAPILSTVAHAQLSRAAAGEVESLHVEEPGQRHAPPGHPESCLLCNVLGRALPEPAQSSALAHVRRAAAVPTADHDQAIQRAACARIQARAPPAMV
ncbi:MAG: hypothetical protein P3B98_13815 [Gemmatimonadota bacterium]|nr:hypothetical protein [Gemmatimonadota bacterium]